MLRQKIIAAIDNEMVDKTPNKDKIIFFLPENELHELSLLFYSFIAKERGYEVIYLGASVPITDLIKIQKVTKAKAMFSAYVNAAEKAELEDMFVQLRETFPNMFFYVTGLQIKELNPTLPPDFYIIPSAKVFKEELKKLSSTN